MKKLYKNNVYYNYIYMLHKSYICALSDRAVSMEERAMACCVRGYHVYMLYSNGHQIQRDVDPPDPPISRCYSGRWNGGGERSFRIG